MREVPGVDPRRGHWRQRWDLVTELVGRELRLRYRRSVLGIVWSQLAPLVTLGVLTFVFTRVVPLGLDDFPAFALIGLLSWNWLSDGLVAAAGSVVEGRDLIRQPRFPRSLLPVVAVSAHLVQFALAWPIIVLAVALDTGRVPATIVLLPVVALVQMVVMAGPAFLVAGANVRFRDVQHLVGVGLLPLFWASPVFYPVSAVPDRLRGLYELNPAVHLLSAYRDVALHGELPPVGPLAVIVVAGAVVAGGVVWRYRRISHRFIEEL